MKELRMNNEFSINADTVKEMLQKHNHILKQQIEFLQSIPNCEENSKATAKLNQRIATLQKEIKEEKDNISEPVNQGSREETSTLKKKVKYLKREHDELEEFIKKEIEFEREEDDKTIKELNETITNLTNEIQQTKERLNKSKSSQFASEYAEVTRRVKLAKQKIAQSNHDIISLRAENEKLAASIEIEKESTHRLEKERDTLQKLIRSIKESTV
ncbi:hypothetical protein TRFO_40284 [Tritrichomonas foetus]|uniref:Uncharacterized protein n=1 Tax=Tritrichomonas foetus TaxID=1144522 RepID=A0A1J4J1M5_9EUKA|nr:hypothetical protein TRFO_40284 [Tritrichomonas foetus]|eukprot:OHS93446.1 hypothetical protein TRFO_40284 [Tritrichomonas foetus]